MSDTAVKLYSSAFSELLYMTSRSKTLRMMATIIPPKRPMTEKLTLLIEITPTR